MFSWLILIDRGLELLFCIEVQQLCITMFELRFESFRRVLGGVFAQQIRTFERSENALFGFQWAFIKKNYSSTLYVLCLYTHLMMRVWHFGFATQKTTLSCFLLAMTSLRRNIIIAYCKLLTIYFFYTFCKQIFTENRINFRKRTKLCAFCLLELRMFKPSVY